MLDMLIQWLSSIQVALIVTLLFMAGSFLQSDAQWIEHARAGLSTLELGVSEVSGARNSTERLAANFLAEYSGGKIGVLSLRVADAFSKPPVKSLASYPDVFLEHVAVRDSECVFLVKYQVRWQVRTCGMRT